jgi:hypothetical protein
MNHTSMKRLTLIVVGATVSLWTLVALGTIAGAQNVTPPAHRFIKVAEDVYAAVGNGTIQTQDTVAVVVNRDDVRLVDTNITPSHTAARQRHSHPHRQADPLRRQHALALPPYRRQPGVRSGVRIIGHENTRKTILAGVLHKRLEQAFRDLPNALANTRKRLAAEQNPSAKERFSGSSRYRRHIRRSSKRPSGICGARRKRYTSRRCRWLKLPSGST